MRKRTIIISISALLVIVLATVGVLYVINNGKNTSTSQATKPTHVIPDLSHNYGACDLFNITSIKSALGSPAASITDGFNTGIANSGGGDTAQNCVYGLSTKVTEVSDTMLMNSFYTLVYVYKNQANKDGAGDAYDGATLIPGIGDKAGFISYSDKTLKYTDYSLHVDSGLRYFVYSIRVPLGSPSFTDSSAEDALTKLAKSVDYTKFDSKT